MLYSTHTQASRPSRLMVTIKQLFILLSLSAWLTLAIHLNAYAIDNTIAIATKESYHAHQINGKFQNPAGSPESQKNPFKWTLFSLRMAAHTFTINTQAKKIVLPQKEFRDQRNKLDGQDNITWLGHSTFLISLDGLNILTDPFLTSLASPIPVPGLFRYAPSVIKPAELPDIDVIVISHSHYDHLDTKTLKVIAKHSQPTVYVPLGLGKLVSSVGFENVIERDWYQETPQETLTITCLPAIHNSARTLFGKDKTLWAGWSIKSSDHNIYFAGDTGYGEVFSEIGKRVGPFDTALVPIGAYNPFDVLGPGHVNPEQAIQIGKDIGAKHLIGMHWGTLPFSLEPIFEPPERFQAGEHPSVTRTVMKIGESRSLVTL